MLVTQARKHPLLWSALSPALALTPVFNLRYHCKMSRIETQDAALTETNGVFDISFDAEGDILTKDFFDTSLLMTVYCERRADASEMPSSHLRRGWIGNLETPDFEIGSKLWLWYQARKNNDTTNGITTALTNAASWLLDDEFVISYTVATVFTSEAAFAQIDIFRSRSKVDRRLFELWNNTGQ